MTHARVTGVRSIDLGVRDLHRSAEFYAKVWALEEVSSEGDSIRFALPRPEPLPQIPIPFPQPEGVTP